MSEAASATVTKQLWVLLVLEKLAMPWLET